MESFSSSEVKKLSQVLSVCKNQQVFVIGTLPEEIGLILATNENKVTKDGSAGNFDIVVSLFGFEGLAQADINSSVLDLMKKLKVGGKLIFVEQCARFTNSKVEGKVDASVFTNFVSSKFMNLADNQTICFEIVQQFGFNQNVQDSNLIEKSCWVFELCERHTKDGRKDFTTFQQYLDKSRYSYTHILRYEKIFGEDFVSTGGISTTTELCAKLGVKEGEQILDVGCGIGGSAFHFVEKYKAKVDGFDLSENMIELARNKNQKYKYPNIDFSVADATKIDYEPGSYDIVYSRDTILHIPPKNHLFSQFYKWMRPGGRLLITDYCCGPYHEHDDDFKAYVSERGYSMLTVEDYAQVLRDVGFVDVVGVDLTAKSFLSILQKELDKFESTRDEFIEKFSQKDYDDISEGWKDKLQRCKKGDQRWGLFTAKKL